MALFPLSMANQLRPAANADYFLHRNRLLAWFSRRVLDIIPLTCESSHKNRDRNCSHRHFFKHCAEALAKKQILILYPEGSRGQPESLSEFKGGIAHLAKRHPDVPIVPICLRGFGKAIPKGDPLLVPFVCKAHIGEALFWNGHKQQFVEHGVMLEYVYRNQPGGITPLGTLIDWLYLNSQGWRGIRERSKVLKATLREVLMTYHQQGIHCNLLDVACGGGRYDLEVLLGHASTALGTHSHVGDLSWRSKFSSSYGTERHFWRCGCRKI